MLKSHIQQVQGGSNSPFVITRKLNKIKDHGNGQVVVKRLMKHPVFFLISDKKYLHLLKSKCKNFTVAMNNQTN